MFAMQDNKKLSTFVTSSAPTLSLNDDRPVPQPTIDAITLVKPSTSIPAISSCHQQRTTQILTTRIQKIYHDILQQYYTAYWTNGLPICRTHVFVLLSCFSFFLQKAQYSD